MGVEYRHYLIPKPNGFVPTPEDLSRFIAAATTGKWLPATNPEVRSRGTDRILAWPIESPAITYPLSPVEIPPQDRYFEIQVHESRHFVYRTSECIDPFESTSCACGAGLEIEGDDGFYLQGSCPGCRKEFDPSDLPATYRHPMTGEESLLIGGATSRFAIVIDCGKCVPSESQSVSVDPRLLELCQSELRAPFYEVGDVY